MVLLDENVELACSIAWILFNLGFLWSDNTLSYAVRYTRCRSGINGQCMPPQLQRCMHQRHTPGLSTEQEQHGHTRQQIGVLRPLRPSDLVTRMAGSK